MNKNESIGVRINGKRNKEIIEAEYDYSHAHNNEHKDDNARDTLPLL